MQEGRLGGKSLASGHQAESTYGYKTELGSVLLVIVPKKKKPPRKKTNKKNHHISEFLRISKSCNSSNLWDRQLFFIILQPVLLHNFPQHGYFILW